MPKYIAKFEFFENHLVVAVKLCCLWGFSDIQQKKWKQMMSFCHMLLATKSLKAQLKMGSLQSCLFIQHWFIRRVGCLFYTGMEL